MPIFFVCDTKHNHGYTMDDAPAPAINQPADLLSGCSAVVCRYHWHSHGLGGLASANRRQFAVGLDRELRAALTNL